MAVSTFKAETYRFLRLDRPTDEEIGAGIDASARHHPPAGLGRQRVVKQFVAEQLVTVKNKRGFQRLEWQKLRERNEALDARVYARAAAWIIGVDRWSDDRWQALETELRDSSPATQSRDMMSRNKKREGQGSAPSRDDVWLKRRSGWLR